VVLGLHGDGRSHRETATVPVPFPPPCIHDRFVACACEAVSVLLSKEETVSPPLRILFQPAIDDGICGRTLEWADCDSANIIVSHSGIELHLVVAMHPPKTVTDNDSEMDCGAMAGSKENPCHMATKRQYLIRRKQKQKYPGIKRQSASQLCIRLDTLR
jgi:hypothetical protein